MPAPSIGAVASRPVLPPPTPASLPDLEAIGAQKQAYLDSLAEQVQQGEEMLKEQQRQQTVYIYDAAEAQKQQLIHQIDQLAKQQELQLSQKYSQQQLALRQEFHRQKMLLEKQANELAIEFQRGRAQERRAQQELGARKAHVEDQLRMMNEMQQAALSPGTSPLSPSALACAPSAPLTWAQPLIDMAAFDVQGQHPQGASPLSPVSPSALPPAFQPALPSRVAPQMGGLSVAAPTIPVGGLGARAMPTHHMF